MSTTAGTPLAAVDLTVEGPAAVVGRVDPANALEPMVGSQFRVVEAWVVKPKSPTPSACVEFSRAVDVDGEDCGLFVVRQVDLDVARMLADVDLPTRAASRIMVLQRNNAPWKQTLIGVAHLVAQRILPVPIETDEDRLLWSHSLRTLAVMHRVPSYDQLSGTS